MEKAGYSEAQLNEFAEFEFVPDQDYVNKINTTGKKFARFYKSVSGHTMMGYLLPFTLHAHAEVHKYIWDVGMGVLTDEGYGMIDIVK
jgi:CRISPR-associated endoribonuclease Cas6